MSSLEAGAVKGAKYCAQGFEEKRTKVETPCQVPDCQMC